MKHLGFQKQSIDVPHLAQLQLFNEIMKIVKSLPLVKFVVIEVKSDITEVADHADKTARRITKE